VAHAALFGSRARGDIDFAGLKGYIAEFFDSPVDVVSRDGLKSYIRLAATAHAIYAF